MQLKTLTALAASLALAQASVSGGWGDHTKSPVLDTTTAPSATKPAEVPTGKPSNPVDGGKTDVADSTAEESSTWAETDFPSSPVDGGKTDVADKTTTSAAEESSTWIETDFPSSPVDGGKTDVADKTTTSAAESSTQAYWGDASQPVDGGKTDVADKTTTSAAESSTETYWGDASKPVDGGKTDVADETTTSATWGDHTGFPTETPVSGGEGKPPGGPPAGPPAETPVSGGQGKPPGGPPAGPPAETPVSGGQGKPPGGPGAPGGGQGCGAVTTTVTSVVTVTVPAGGKPTKPADTTTPAVETSTFSATWQDQATGFQTSAAPAPSQGGYMGIISEWRSKMGLPALENDSKLQNNAQDAANSSGGQLKHKLNSGSMAQVMAPGDSDNFESVFVGGWLCELPNTPGLGSSVCNEMSKGWNYAGQTGHAEILTDKKYTKIGCGLGDGIWCCDLA